MKKCPPGVLCIENATLCMFLIAFSIFIWFCYSFNHFNKASQVIVKNHYEPNLSQGQNQRQGENGQNLNPLYPSFVDVIRNPYAPPRYFFPINVSTNVGALDTTFRQVGILHPVKGPNKDNVLALMGRPVFTNRDMWQYYTIGNQLNHVKLPILTNRKNGLNEYGVNRLYSRDVVYVEGLNDAYRVTIYENDTLRYLPAI
jgi:hypothetical protein